MSSVKASTKGDGKPKIAVLKDAAAPKPKKAPKHKPEVANASGFGIVQFAKDTIGASSTLASDILADRIVTTIEQIKAVAAYALGKDKKPKGGRKTPKTK